MYIKILLFNDDVDLVKRIRLEDWDSFKLELESKYIDFGYIWSYCYI